MRRSVEWIDEQKELVKLTFSVENLVGYEFHERIGNGASGAVYRVTRHESGTASGSGGGFANDLASSPRDNLAGGFVGGSTYAAKITKLTTASASTMADPGVVGVAGEVKMYKLMSEMKIAPAFITHEICKVDLSTSVGSGGDVVDAVNETMEVSVIISELFETNLQTAMRTIPWEVKKHAMEITKWLFEANAEMEAIGYLHSDIHPANVVINFMPLKIRIVDFEFHNRDADNYIGCWRNIYRAIWEEI